MDDKTAANLRAIAATRAATPAMLTDDRAALILESLAAGCSLDVALAAQPRVDRATFRAYCGTHREYERACDAAIVSAKEEAWKAAQRVSAEAQAAEMALRPRAPREAPAKAAAPAPTLPERMMAGDAVLDWARVRDEAARLAPGPFGFVLWQEERLAASGQNFPRLSPFSLYTIERFFASLKRWMLLMAGRGYGKSTLTGRLAAVLGMFTSRKPAPGPSWVCPIVSVLPIDADRRLEDVQAIMLHAYLRELKIALAKSTIVTDDAGGNQIAWVSSASTIGNVSGPSSFAALVDEEEKIFNGKAGGIIGSLAYTFRSREGVRGFRVSSAMGTDGTLANDCAKGQTITNFVATLGKFLDVASEGLLAVADWEERGDAKVKRSPNVEAAQAIRAHVATLTEESWHIPTWLGHPSTGCPENCLVWSAGEAAIATRIEAEAVPEKARDGLAPWRYWLRECCSVPTGRGANAGSGDQIRACAEAMGIKIDDKRERRREDRGGESWRRML